MDQGTLVENQIIDDGRRFVERFAADGNPVSAAFWGKREEEDSWYLYVASELYDRGGPAVAYRAVRESMDKLGDSQVSTLDIKAIGRNHPIAKDVMALMSLYPGRLVNRPGERTFGRVNFDQVYIYPEHVFHCDQLHPMTSEDVVREIIRLMTRGPGSVQPSRVVLKDGASFNGVPVALATESQKGVIVQFFEDGDAARREVRLDEIAAIA